MSTEISYIEVDLQEILQHYLQGYSFSNGNTIISSETFVDVEKGKVIYKLFISGQNN